MDDTISQQLRQLLKDSGWTSEQVSKAIGITPVSVRRFRAGISGLSIPKLQELAHFLGYEIVVKRRSGPGSGTSK